MVAIYRRNDTFGTVWCIGIASPVAGTAASFTDTIAGTATAAGTMALYIGGDRYSVVVAAGDDGVAIADKVAAAVNAQPFAIVTAEADDDEIKFTAKTPGLIGNEITRLWNWRGVAAGEMFPPGSA